MQNISEPRLPTHGLKSHIHEEQIGYLLLAVLSGTLCIELPVMYTIFLFLKFISSKIYKVLNEMCTKSKKVDCSAEVNWNNRGKVCDNCIGSCKCSHKVTELLLYRLNR